ncbi:hypothetical protein V1509DRAFT_194198 [Lipomyces kononenkoae]
MDDILATISHEGAQWLKDNEPESCADSHFPGRRFGHRTSNIAESFNSWILDARAAMPVLSMKYIRLLIMRSKDPTSQRNQKGETVWGDI